MAKSLKEMAMMLFQVVLCGLVAVSAELADPDCKYPGTCTPPANAKYSRVAPLVPRAQWAVNGGYCGALSIQEIAMTYGAWFSQSTIRQQAQDGGGHGDPENGYEILHTNIEGALQKLGLAYSAFPYQTAPYPQSLTYLPWLKANLAIGAPVVWFVMCAGDSHDTYGIGAYDHIEAVFGLYSNNSLNDANVYGDDVLVHTSDYAPDGTQNFGYFRPFDTLTDTPAFDGNCSKAVPEFMHNEMYPCLSFNESYGYAINGFSQGPTLPLFMTLDAISEPDTTQGEDPAPVTATVTVSDVEDNVVYHLYRFDRGNFVVPASQSDYPTEADWVLEFTGGLNTQNSTFVWTDSHQFTTDMSVAYRAVQVGTVPPGSLKKDLDLSTLAWRPAAAYVKDRVMAELEKHKPVMATA